MTLHFSYNLNKQLYQLIYVIMTLQAESIVKALSRTIWFNIDENQIDYVNTCISTLSADEHCELTRVYTRKINNLVANIYSYGSESRAVNSGKNELMRLIRINLDVSYTTAPALDTLGIINNQELLIFASVQLQT
jgi:hypothetical protein